MESTHIQAWLNELETACPGSLLPTRHLEAYATDASLFRKRPLAVMTPTDREQVARAIRICANHQVPVTARGGGTSLTGQSIGQGLILDLSTSFRRIVEINVKDGWVRVQPGVTRDALNAALANHGMHFAPDPASGYAATVGGMISTNAAGMRSIRHGMTVDHLLEVTVVLADGSVQTFSADQGLEHPSVVQLRAWVDAQREEIARRTPHVLRLSGGYRLEALLRDPFNPASIFCSAEGTLGVIVEARLRITPLPRCSAVCVIPFQEVWPALRLAGPLATCGISALELLDEHALRPARNHPLTTAAMQEVPSSASSILILEAQAEVEASLEKILRQVAEVLTRFNMPTPPMLRDPIRQRGVWSMRSAALGLISHGAGRTQPQPYIEDAAVPLDHLEAYIREVESVCSAHGRSIALFAHASVGLLHIRPLHDLSDHSEQGRMAAIQREVFARVLAHGGSWSGEHGDGLVRGAQIPELFGEVLSETFRKIKRTFDPLGLLNPGKKIGVPPAFDGPVFAHHQTGPGWKPRFRYDRPDGLAGEIGACNGLGHCRQELAGAMCPSFRATRRENDTVRGRARQLQQALRSPEDLRPSLEALALCLNCKACKHECPNRVDMSRLKSETLAEAYAREGIPLRERLLSQPGDWLNRLPSWLTRNRSAAALAGRLLGLSPDRPLPKPAAERFTRLWQKHGSRWKRHGRPRAAIFIDTWTEFYQPSAGIALARILHGMGYTPDPRWLGDSQRVAISRGCLMEAKTRGEALFIALDQWDSETPILTLEPSCHSALTDDLPDLLADVKRAKRVAARIEPAEAFLARPLGANPTSLFRSDLPPLRLLIHPHCHARAAGQADAILALCKRVPGVEARETRAGCCGLAGWWGYAKENAALSRRIAEDRFLPAIRGLNDGERFAASGFSCRCQAEALAEVQPRHPLEWLAERLSGVPE